MAVSGAGSISTGGVVTLMSFTDVDERWRRRLGEQSFDNRRAAAQHRLLVDRSLLGQLAGINRRRFLEDRRAADGGRRAGVRGCEAGEQPANLRLQDTR